MWWTDTGIATVIACHLLMLHRPSYQVTLDLWTKWALGTLIVTRIRTGLVS